MKIWPQIDHMTADRSHHSENFFPCQNIAKPYSFGDICEKLLSDPYVLFLVKAAMFLDGSNIPTTFLWKIPQETFIPSLIQTGQVVSGEKSLEKLLMTMDDDDGH